MAYVRGVMDVAEAVSCIVQWAVREVMEKQKDGRVDVTVEYDGQITITSPKE